MTLKANVHTDPLVSMENLSKTKTHMRMNKCVSMCKDLVQVRAAQRRSTLVSINHLWEGVFQTSMVMTECVTLVAQL